MCTLRLLALLLAFAPLAAHAAPTPPDLGGGPRIRPYDARSAAVLLEGLERSATLRAIADRLEQLDVIVYIEMQPALRHKLAGTLTWLTAAGGYRYVRISLNPSLMHDLVIASLGHELQHALEVAEAPSVRDSATLESYYRRNGMGTSQHVNGWDTLAARDVGNHVRRELSGARVSRVAESIQHFNPDEWHIVYRRARSMLPP